METFKSSSVNIGGINTSTMGRVELAKYIGDMCTERKKGTNGYNPFIIFSNNGHAISLYNSNLNTKKLMDNADLIHADGQSVVYFSKIFGDKKIKERTATTDMIHDIPKYYKNELKHIFLGGKGDVVTNAAYIMQKRYKNMHVCGVFDGYFEEYEESEICSKINELNADILWVGLGKPKEQEFCIRNKSKLNIPVIISCGGCYNYITGDYARAPLIIQKIGLEWLYRLITNPSKLFFRYLVTNPHSIYCAFKYSLRNNGKS